MDGEKELPEEFLTYYWFIIVRVWNVLTNILTKDKAGHGARWVWKYGFTPQFIFPTGVLLYFVYTRGDYEDTQPFVDTWLFVKSAVVDYVWFHCFLLAVLVEGYRLRKILGNFLRKYLSELLIERVIIRVSVIWKGPCAFWQMLADRHHIFYSLEDSEHVARAAEKSNKGKKKRYFGIPKRFRPPTIDERRQITPQQQPDVGKANIRVSSSGSNSGSGRNMPTATGSQGRKKRR